MSSTAYVDIRPQGSVAPPPPQPQTAHDTPDEPATPDPDPPAGGNQQHDPQPRVSPTGVTQPGKCPASTTPRNGRTPDLAEVRGLPWVWDVKDTRNPTANTQPCPSDRDRQPEHAVSHISVPYLGLADHVCQIGGLYFV